MSVTKESESGLGNEQVAVVEVIDPDTNQPIRLAINGRVALEVKMDSHGNLHPCIVFRVKDGFDIYGVISTTCNGEKIILSEPINEIVHISPCDSKDVKTKN